MPRKKKVYTLDDLIRIAKEEAACTAGINWVKAYQKAHPTHTASQFFRNALSDSHNRFNPNPRGMSADYWLEERRANLRWVLRHMVAWPVMVPFAYRSTMMDTNSTTNLRLVKQIFGLRFPANDIAVYTDIPNEKIPKFLATIYETYDE